MPRIGSFTVWVYVARNDLSGFQETIKEIDTDQI